MMSDGPFCVPSEKFYSHSKLLYENPASAMRSANKFGQLWFKAKTFAETNQTLALKESDDKDSFIVGV